MTEELKEKKTAVRKTASKTGSTAPRKPRVAKKDAVAVDRSVQAPIAEVVVATPVEAKPAKAVASVPNGKYLFSTGRRKTAVANIRLFSGKGENVVNKKKFDVYFSHSTLRDEALQAFRFTGLNGQYYFKATVNGGGIRAQAQAVRHGISQALSTLGEEVRRVLKKNGLLTRDDRKKERKKPGLKRARRSPQWAKR